MLLLFSLVYLTRLRHLLSSAISEGFTLRAGGVPKQKGRGEGALVENVEKYSTPKRYKDPLLWAWLEIFYP